MADIESTSELLSSPQDDDNNNDNQNVNNDDDIVMKKIYNQNVDKHSTTNDNYKEDNDNGIHLEKLINQNTGNNTNFHHTNNINNNNNNCGLSSSQSINNKPPLSPQKRKNKSQLIINNFENDCNSNCINKLPPHNNLMNLDKNKIKRPKIDTIVVADVKNIKTTHKNERIVAATAAAADTTTVPPINNSIIITKKPPLPPPKSNNLIGKTIPNNNNNYQIDMKNKKLIEDNHNNGIIIQKSNALIQQLRLHITELNGALNTERAAVRTIRVQFDGDLRKAKIDLKKLQDALQLQKTLQVASAAATTTTTTPSISSVGIKRKSDIAKLKNNSIGTAPATQNNIKNSNSNNNNNIKKESSIIKVVNGMQQMDIAKLTQEISILKEANKFLEEKIQISSDADRRKASDIRELKDSYELRLTQISKSAKIGIHRLLEEIKLKDKSIGQLKKEIVSLKEYINKRDTSSSSSPTSSSSLPRKKVQRTQNVRKNQEEIEQNNCIITTNLNNSNNNNNNINNKNKNNINTKNITTNKDNNNNNQNNLLTNQTTCGIEIISMPHEMHDERQDLSSSSGSSDNDSAVSSAPPSLSPQPGTFSNGIPDVWNSFIKDSKELENLQKDYETLQEENVFLNCELSSAKDQLKDFEDSLFMMRDTTRTLNEEHNNKINCIEQKEKYHLKEIDELREQNELLEFRIIELEESYDKHTKNNSKSVNYRDISTNTEDRQSQITRANNDVIVMYSDDLSAESGTTRTPQPPPRLPSSKSDNSFDIDSDHQQQCTYTGSISSTLIDDDGDYHQLHNQHPTAAAHPTDIEQLSNEDIRKRILLMSTRNCYDDEDKMCLLQILSLLNNLEAISQDHEISGDDHYLGLNISSKLKSSTSDLSAMTSPSSASRPSSLFASPLKGVQERIVATVQPYSSGNGTIDSIYYDGGDCNKNAYENNVQKKNRYLSTLSLQESGVFVENDLDALPECLTKQTQTDSIDYPSIEIGIDDDHASNNEDCNHNSINSIPDNNTTDHHHQHSITGKNGTVPTRDKNNNTVSINESELSVEILKLNTLRKKIEESTITKKTIGNNTMTTANSLSTSTINNGNTLNASPPGSSTSTSTSTMMTSDQKRLQFYQERLELLENKLLVYESTGDLQARRLTERLQRELQLESWLKQLNERCEKLEIENDRLEEEKCEFEEAENDTRLHLQKLEVDLDILTQRNIELELSRDRFKAHTNCLQDSIDKAQDHIYALEEQEIDLKNKIDLFTSIVPTILLFNNFKLKQFLYKKWQLKCKCPVENINNKDGAADLVINGGATTPCVKVTNERCLTVNSHNNNNNNDDDSNSTELPLIVSDQLNELINRERELTQYISELKQAYNETIERADNFWAQMEKEYKDKINEAEESQEMLKTKLTQVEGRSKKDSQYALERINQLEESENQLKLKVNKLNIDYKTIAQKYQMLHDELLSLTDEYTKLRAYLEGPATEQLHKEKSKVKELQNEIDCCNKMLCELDDNHKMEMLQLKNQLNQLNRELINAGVSNAELKEEVITLENRILELSDQKLTDENIIKNLMNAIKLKQMGKLSTNTNTTTTINNSMDNMENNPSTPSQYYDSSTSLDSSSSSSSSSTSRTNNRKTSSLDIEMEHSLADELNTNNNNNNNSHNDDGDGLSSGNSNENIQEFKSESIVNSDNQLGKIDVTQQIRLFEKSMTNANNNQRMGLSKINNGSTKNAEQRVGQLLSARYV